jgi:hypothetical protein
LLLSSTDFASHLYKEKNMRTSLIAAVLLSAVTSFAVAQTGKSGDVHPGSQSTGDAHEKQSAPIAISPQSGTASGERGATGTRGSDSDSSITGRSRSPDVNYGSPVVKKVSKVKKHKTVKRRTTRVAARVAP